MTLFDLFIVTLAATAVGGVIVAIVVAFSRGPLKAAVLHVYETIRAALVRRPRRRPEQDRRRVIGSKAIASLDSAVTFLTVVELLSAAYTEGLFTKEIYLKTSTKRGQPLLEVEVVDDQRIGFIIYTPADSGFLGEQFEFMSEGTAVWDEGEDPDIIIGRVISAYKRTRLPYDKLSLETSFSLLNQSYRIMHAARQEPAGSIKSLTGRLQFLVNDEWVLTDVGLESTVSGTAFEYKRGILGTREGIRIGGIPCPTGCDPTLWEEAQYYMQRMHWMTSDPRPSI